MSSIVSTGHPTKKQACGLVLSTEINVMHRYLFAIAHLCKLGAARGERWGGGGEAVSPFLALWRLHRQNVPRNSTSESARRATYLLVRSVYRGNQTRWVATNRIKEKGGPADTGLVHWACCSRRYRVTIKSSVGGDGGRVSRELFGKRRWKKIQER